MDQIEEEELELTKLFTLIDLDKDFENNPLAKVVNNDTLVSKKLSKEFTDAIFSQSDGELGFVPTCQCGKTSGIYRKGLICPYCGTECSSQFIDSLNHISYIGIKDNFPPVLHPVWFKILRSWTSIGRKNQSIIDMILNPEEEMAEDFMQFLGSTPEEIKNNRGFKYFYEHADEILDIFLHKYNRTAKKPTAKAMIPFIRHYRNKMFIRHLPILHSSLHPLKRDGESLNYADNSSKEILEAIIDLSLMTFRRHAVRVSQRQLDKFLYDIYIKIINYYNLIIVEKLGKKHALLRKHVFGSRLHFSARAVITPHEKVLPMDEVVLPWSMMVNGLKLMILNHLTHRHGYHEEEALNKFMKALVQYDPLIDQIITTIIDEYPDHRLPVAVGRNPTLVYGSIMLLFVRTYHKDPSDETMAISAGITDPPNAGTTCKTYLQGVIPGLERIAA